MTVTINEYPYGTMVRYSANFKNSADANADPTTVTCRIKDPSGTTTVYVYGTDPEIVKDSVGNYHIDLEGDIEGVWYDRWEGTGAVIAAAESKIYIPQSNFF